MKTNFERKPTMEIDFEDHKLTKPLDRLAYGAEHMLEDNMAMTLVTIQGMASMNENAFGLHKTLYTTTLVD